MNMPPDMVLFDCDGVLVDSETLTADVLCRNLSRYGLETTPEQLSLMFLGGTMMGLAETAKSMGASLHETWIDEAYAEVFAALDAQVEAIPGAQMVLERLTAASIPFAVGSNGPHRKMEITLNRTGLIEYLRGRVYSREDVPSPKPAPDMYLKAAADAGYNPERCVVIEDSPNGARAGQAAGMKVFGFAAETDPNRLAPVCDRLFFSMDELPGLLGL